MLWFDGKRVAHFKKSAIQSLKIPKALTERQLHQE